MKKRVLLVVAALLVALILTGCTTFKVSGLSYGKQDVEVLGTFETKVKVMKFMGTSGGATFFDLGQDNTDRAVRDAIRDEVEKLGGDGAINVSIEQKATFVNMLVNGITGEILAPVTLIISGTVVNY